MVHSCGLSHASHSMRHPRYCKSTIDLFGRSHRQERIDTVSLVMLRPQIYAIDLSSQVEGIAAIVCGRIMQQNRFLNHLDAKKHNIYYCKTVKGRLTVFHISLRV